MELGIFGLNAKAVHGRAETARLARLAEELGYGSWWVGEHVVVPSPRTPDTPMDPRDAMLDPLVHLAFVAAVTERIELGTGIVILPQRNPLVLAKQVASLDALAGRAVLLGVGAGYLEPELKALGVAMSERGRRNRRVHRRDALLVAGRETGLRRPVRVVRRRRRPSAPGA
jgi:alkanesulfonate monooxygenase SsuD/methylene tetrahydromethanopterin reductase-like flavin-dependent oxidoreductase (luciferase family)